MPRGDNLEINWRYHTSDEFRPLKPRTFYGDEDDDNDEEIPVADPEPVEPPKWYCIPCSKAFVTESGMIRHFEKGKKHKVKLARHKYEHPELYNSEDAGEPPGDINTVDTNDIQNIENAFENFGVVEVTNEVQLNENAGETENEDPVEALITDISEMNLLDHFDFFDFYKSTSPVVKYEKKNKCNPKREFEGLKTKEFCQAMIKHSVSQEGRLALMEWVAKWYTDSTVPTTNYFLNGAIEQHFPPFAVFEQEVAGKTVSFHSLEEIMHFILDSAFELHFEYEEVELKTQENHFEAWKLLQHETKKTLFLKVFLDKYEITSRKKRQANGCYFTLANFKPADQRSLETKFILSIFPEEKDIEWSKKYTKFYWYVFNVLIVQLMKLEETGIDHNGVYYSVQLYCLIGDFPGQCEGAGVSGHPTAKMPNLRCTGDILSGGNPCVLRDPVEHFLVAAEVTPILDAQVWGTIGKAEKMQKEYSLTNPISPFWLVLTKRYFERLGICRMHCLYEGVGPLMMNSLANEHGDNWVENTHTKLSQITHSNNFGLPHEIFWKKKSVKTGNVFKWKLNLETARQKKFVLFVLWTIVAHDNSLSNEEKSIFHLFMVINHVVCQTGLTDEDIDKLEEVCLQFYEEFQQKYNDSPTTNTKRPNLHTMIHLAPTFLGLLDQIDTVYHETIHGTNKQAKSNNHHLERDIMLIFGQRRSYLPVVEELVHFKPASHCCPDCTVIGAHPDGCWFKKIFFLAKKKIEIGDHVRIDTVVDDQELPPIWGQIESIRYLASRLLSIEYVEYIWNGDDEFDQEILMKGNTKCDTWRAGDLIKFTKLSVGNIDENTIFVSKFWCQDHTISF